MNDTLIVNTELEQALYTASQREQTMRSRSTLAILVPLLIGGIWLAYSGYQVSALQARTRQLEQRAAEQNERDAAVRAAAAQTEANLANARSQSASFESAEKSARDKVAGLQAALVKLRSEVDALETVIGELNSLRSKVSLMNNSYAAEVQIAGIRSDLTKGFANIGKQIDAALPDVDRKPWVHLVMTDDALKDAARQLKTELEASGFEVGAVTKNTTRRLESTDVRFRHSKDKSEALRIQEILEKKLGVTDTKVTFSEDSSGSGAGKFQVWLKKPAATSSSR